MNKRFDVPGENEFYDIYAPDRYLNSIPEYDPAMLESWDKFQKDQSKDFYAGMIAGFRISMSVFKSWIEENPHLIYDYLTDCSLSATLLAKSKR